MDEIWYVYLGWSSKTKDDHYESDDGSLNAKLRDSAPCKGDKK